MIDQTCIVVLNYENVVQVVSADFNELQTQKMISH